MLIFEAVTGLKVNLAKCGIFSINADGCIEELADILGCKVEKFPTVYLGLPLGAKRNNQSTWRVALDRSVSRRTPWKKQ